MRKKSRIAICELDGVLIDPLSGVLNSLNHVLCCLELSAPRGLAMQHHPLPAIELIISQVGHANMIRAL